MNNSFWSFFMWFFNGFHPWLHHLWKSLANQWNFFNQNRNFPWSSNVFDFFFKISLIFSGPNLLIHQSLLHICITKQWKLLSCLILAVPKIHIWGFNFTQSNATKPRPESISNDFSNDLVQSGIKPFCKPIFTQFFVIIILHYATMT